MSSSDSAHDSFFKSSLISKNITVLGRRTSVRLEPEMWRELKNITKREKCSIHQLCSLISIRKPKNSSLTAAIRVFLMLYFRAAATENGHERAGHGNFENMQKRAGIPVGIQNFIKPPAEENVQEHISARLEAHLSAIQKNSMKASLILMSAEG